MFGRYVSLYVPGPACQKVVICVPLYTLHYKYRHVYIVLIKYAITVYLLLLTLNLTEPKRKHLYVQCERIIHAARKPGKQQEISERAQARLGVKNVDRRARLYSDVEIMRMLHDSRRDVMDAEDAVFGTP